MAKYRIVKRNDKEFVIQERVLFFWWTDAEVDFEHNYYYGYDTYSEAQEGLKRLKAENKDEVIFED